MALMFPRLARNFARNGYFPTDEVTLERALQALAPAESGPLRIADLCAGEGVALAELAHHLGRENTQAFAVEYDPERAAHTAGLVDRCIQGDLMDVVISRQAFGALWLNPPYGDLVADHSATSLYQGKGRRRLEKLFYQQALPTLQYGGVLVFIIPAYSLDEELATWLASHFRDVRVYRAPEQRFQQVVIYGVRSRRQDLGHSVAEVRNGLVAAGQGLVSLETLPEVWTLAPYVVPASRAPMEQFYRVSLDASSLGAELSQAPMGLWRDFDVRFGGNGRLADRPPARSLSQWHLALVLAAGGISGVVTSRSGRTFIVKGDTFKDKVVTRDVIEEADGSLVERRILTDRFVPVIRAWDMTPGSETHGTIITIR